MKLPHRFTARVVGVSFVEGYPDNLLQIRDVLDGEAPVSATLVRDPGNRYDGNAVRVEVEGWGLVGHIDRVLAARLAPEMDAGAKWGARVLAVNVHPDNPRNPGIEVLCERSEGNGAE